ncbi:MAG: tetratricopeptide repeat protein [Chloroflexia bacterium]|nr:tetratricopeptide repeat protein [Chloroflexia bacterium]
MDTLVLLVLLGLLTVVGAVVTTLLIVRRRRTDDVQPSTPHAEPGTADATAREARGARRGKRMARFRTYLRSLSRRQALVLALIVGLIIVSGGYLLVQDRLVSRADRFIVVVAPFDDGGDGTTGASVASELVRVLQGAGQRAIVARVARQRPTDPVEALALAVDAEADLLIWGQVEAGSLLDQAALRPFLIYTPTGIYGPNAWDGYLSRFTLPRSYILTTEAINGQAVLAPLVVALYDYAMGEPERALTRLDQLQKDYPALETPLIYALRGNIFWARGLADEAASQYRQALALPGHEQALLANNLGAILFDGGNPEALAAYAEAVRQLDGRDLGELRVNLALLAFREQRPADAVVELEQARNLLPDSAPLLLELTTGYRETGQLQAAATALEEAEDRMRQDTRLVPTPLRVMFNYRHEARVYEAQALLALARQLESRGALIWELEIAPVQPVRALQQILTKLQRAVEASEAESIQWRRYAVTEAAAFPGTGLLASAQAVGSERNRDRQRYYYALVHGEIERTTLNERVGFLAALFGTGASRSTSLAVLDELDQRHPNIPAVVNALGRMYRLQGQQGRADERYAQAIQLASQQPEGYFGRGMVAFERGEEDTAANFFHEALVRNRAFFPSHVALAQLAEARGDWATALTHYAALQELRPGSLTTISYARLLRLSGPDSWAKAEAELLGLSTTNAMAAIELARLYNDAGHPERARDIYRDALRLERRNSTAAFELGETLMQLGDYTGAEQALRDALRFDSTNLDARLVLADLYHGPLNDPARADREYEAILEQGLRDPEALERIGDAFMAHGTYDQAITAYREALAAQPGVAQVHFKLGKAYAARGRLVAAIGEQERVLELTAGSPDSALGELRVQAMIALGDLHRRSNNLSLASEFYTQASRLDPNRVNAQLGLGLIAVAQDNWGFAQSYFEAAAALPDGPTDAHAQFWMGESLLRRGDFYGAAERYNRALALDPGFAEAYLGLAQTRHAQGESSLALEIVNQGLAQRPAYAEALLFKGKLLQEQQRHKEAMNAYNQSIAANNTIAETFYRRGVLALQQNDEEQALSDLNRAIQLEANFPDAAYWLGRAYYAQGRYAAAANAFDQALTYRPDFVEAMFYRGLVAEAMGNTAEAIRAYRTVIQLDASSDFAARARVQLDRLT